MIILGKYDIPRNSAYYAKDLITLIHNELRKQDADISITRLEHKLYKIIDELYENNKTNFIDALETKLKEIRKGI